MQIYVALALLVLLAGSGMGNDSKDAQGIHVSSPVPGQRLARGQDLVVKYAVGDAGGQACRVVLVVNGRVLTTRDGCRASVAVSEDDLVLGSNSVELFRQGDDDAQEEEAAVTFEVVEPAPWPSPPGQEAGGDAGGDGACRREDAACSRRVCIHRVGDACVIYHDAWARAHGAVPRILHWVWVGGGGDIPDKFHPMMDSWRRLHPDWQTVIWTDDKVTWELRNRAILLQADTYAELSDIVRLEVVERFGGVYVDTDFEALQPLDGLVQGLEFFVGAEKDLEIAVWGNGEGEIWVCPSLFGAVPGSEVLQALVDALPAQVAENLGQDPNHKTGPYFWTNTFAAARACMGAEEGSCNVEALRLLDPPDGRNVAAAVLQRDISRGTAKVFPRRFFYPYGWWEQDKRGQTFSDAFAVHHWQKNWGGGWTQ